MESLRSIPSIERLRQREAVRALESRFTRENVVEALRAESALLRDRLKERDAPAETLEEFEGRVADRLGRLAEPSLRPVINATGVVIHTNLGRAPLCLAAAERVVAVATTYSNLEYDVAAGARGRRDVHAERLLCRLTGAEAAVLVNNNAAGVLICLAALAYGREVIISRGELVEIGGGFRVPDVMRQSGAVLREVGTTNRTRAADYASAISDRTAMILRVHPSNFRIEGFTERPSLDSLVSLASRFGVLVVDDLGSGYMSVPAGLAPLSKEPSVMESLRAGADVVLFSGDKMFGGPQAGIVAGKGKEVSKVRSHPLMRALRVDKLTYAAFEATLGEYVLGRAEETVPVARMIALSKSAISARAGRLADALASAAIRVELVDGFSTIGGGSVPGATLPTRLVALRMESASTKTLETALRRLSPPVIGRIEADRLLLDLRTVDPAHDELVAELVAQAVVGLAADELR